MVEDNAVNQQLVLLLLQKVGYRADVAANGVEALEALERQPYDAVLMDVEMPEMDGLEATRRIHRRWSREQRPHIIAVTANAMQGERELCIQAGMDDYISKPIHIDALAEALTRVSRRPDAPQAARRRSTPRSIGRLVASLGEQGRRSAAALIDTFLGHVPDLMAALDDRGGARRGRGRSDGRRTPSSPTRPRSGPSGSRGSVVSSRPRRRLAPSTEDATSSLEIEVELERVIGELERVRAELGG